MIKTKWTERTFSFDFPEAWIYNILERLRGTSPRIKDMISNLSEDDLEYKPDNKWSIKEHIGHLADIEKLHEGRIDEFIRGLTELAPADMSNKKTFEANHNSKNINDLINEFNEKRRSLVLKLSTLSDEVQYAKAMHPRLKVLMRPVDVAYFTAEHDDHHLADIREIIKLKNR